MYKFYIFRTDTFTAKRFTIAHYPHLSATAEPQGRNSYLPWSTGNKLPNGCGADALQWPDQIGVT